MASKNESGGFSPKTKFCNKNSSSFDPLSKKSTDESSNQNHFAALRFIIDQVRNIQNKPSVCVFSVQSQGRDISAVDSSQTFHHFAYAFLHLGEIHLIARECLSDDIARNDFRSTWSNYVRVKNHSSGVGKYEQSKAECLPSPQVFIIAHEDVSGLCFSSDGNLLLSCSSNGSIKVISTATYQVLDCYNGHRSCTGIDVNTDTTQFVTANVISSKPFHMAYLYNFERKAPVQYISGFQSSLKCVRFHPNGLYVATASTDKHIKLWSVQQSKEVRSFRDNGGLHPEKLTFSPDGKYIASTHGGCVKIWDISSGKRVKCFDTANPEPCILNVCYNVDGKILAAGGSDKKIHMWNAMSGSSSGMMTDHDLLKSEYLGKTIYCMKSVANFFSCITE